MTGRLLFGRFFALLVIGAAGFAVPRAAVRAAGVLPPSFVTDTVLTAAGGPYAMVTTTTVAAGVTLTLEPGVVVKATSGSRLIVNGNLVAHGTATAPVTFTSAKDDAVGGDTNGDGGATSPNGGDWGWVLFSAGSGGSLRYVTIRYGGYFPVLGRVDAQLIADGAAPRFSHLTVTDGQTVGTGVRLTNSSATLEDSEIADHPHLGYGVTIVGGSPQVLRNDIHGNGATGIAVSGAVGSDLLVTGNRIHGNGDVFQQFFGYRPGLINNAPIIDVRNNWWGDDTGPSANWLYDERGRLKKYINPGGLGQEIIGLVLYDPWTGQVRNQPPTLAYSPEAGYGSDGVHPVVVFRNTPPVFKVVYSDGDNDEPSAARVVVDGVPQELAPDAGQDGDRTNGEQYALTLPTDGLSFGLHRYYFEASDGTATARLPETGDLPFEHRRVPVVLVPGITGTELKHGTHDLWLDFSAVVTDPDDNFLNPLALNPDGTPSDPSVVPGDVIRVINSHVPFFSYDYFGGLVQELRGVGYEEGVDLFVLPYDWRRGVAHASGRLEEKIASVESQTGSARADVVAHSLGGLVVEHYLFQHQNNHGVDKLVLVGTPHLGAPKALKALLWGDTFGVPLVLSSQTMKELATNMYSVYELLPNKTYHSEAGAYYYDLTTGGSPKALDFDGVRELIAARGLNGVAATAAAELQGSGFSDPRFGDLGIESYNISGCDAPTITRILERPNQEYYLGIGAGDETVPFASSDYARGAVRQSYYVPGAEHGRMASQPPVRALISHLLRRGPPGAGDLPPGVLTTGAPCHVSGKLVSVHSPVELHVYDARGNHVGPAENRTVDEAIPGVSYEILGGNKFVFLPDSPTETYTVKLLATDTGSFDLRVATIVADIATQTVFYRNVPVGSTATQATLTVTVDSPDTVLATDQDGDGTFEGSVAPAAVLDQLATEDLTAPVTEATLSGAAGAGGWYRSAAELTLSASDDSSGVLVTEYSRDAGGTWQPYATPLTVSAEGVTTVLYRSVDRAGNAEAVQSTDVKVDLTPPEADIVFRLDQRDLAFSGRDNLSAVTVVDDDRVVRLTDEAGNATELVFSEFRRRRGMRASLIDIRYNGSSRLENRGGFYYRWTYSRARRLVELIQYVRSRHDFTIEAIYSGRRDRTSIRGRDRQTGRILDSSDGLALIRVYTDRGGLDYEVVVP